MANQDNSAYRLMRINQTRVMSNGMIGKCVEYRNARDIDVLFEDGYLKQHVWWRRFDRGQVGHTIVGNKYTTYSGCDYTVIDYDADSKRAIIQFKDGSTKEVCRRVISNGTHILKPGTASGDLSRKEVRLGESKIMNCGLQATIIRYQNNRDIGVKFENGIVIDPCQYKQFKSGSLTPSKSRKVYGRVGEKKRMKNGLLAEIIVYNTYKDITVRFENGLIVQTRYDAFSRGSLTTRKAVKEDQIAEN